MGHIPGGPFCVAVMGLLKCVKAGGGAGKIVKLPKLGKVAIDKRYPVIDVTHLEILIDAMTDDIEKLKQGIIEIADIQQSEEELALLFSMMGFD